MLAVAALPEGETLSNVLDKKVYDFAQQRARGLGVDFTVLDQCNPGSSRSRCSIGLLKLGYDPEHGLERYLVGKAKSDSKEIVRSYTPESFNPVLVDFYKQVGYLPAAILNYLVLLGWSTEDNREDFTLAQMVSEFSLERVVKTRRAST